MARLREVHRGSSVGQVTDTTARIKIRGGDSDEPGPRRNHARSTPGVASSRLTPARNSLHLLGHPPKIRPASRSSCDGCAPAESCDSPQAGASNGRYRKHPLPGGIRQAAGLLVMSLLPCTPMPYSDSIMPPLHDRSRVGSGPARIPHSANGCAVSDGLLARTSRSPTAVLDPRWIDPVSCQVSLGDDEARGRHA